MLRPFVFLLALLASAAPASTVSVLVRGADGRPVADAVVTIETARPVKGPIHFPWPMLVSQKDISFQPHVLIAPVGATVSFPNMDSVRHHVYSFSKAKKFQIKLYGKETPPGIVFDKPGVVAIGCNIHDSMSGFIDVVTTPYAAKTDASGRADIADVPVGAATLTVWSPAIRAPDNRISQPLDVPAGAFAKTIAIGS